MGKQFSKSFRQVSVMSSPNSININNVSILCFVFFQTSNKPTKAHKERKFTVLVPCSVESCSECDLQSAWSIFFKQMMLGQLLSVGQNYWDSSAPLFAFVCGNPVHLQWAWVLHVYSHTLFNNLFLGGGSLVSSKALVDCLSGPGGRKSLPGLMERS